MSDSGQGKKKLTQVHECLHCGSRFRREEFDEQALILGVHLCPKCGHESPLNVVIKEDDEPTSNKDCSPPDSSGR